MIRTEGAKPQVPVPVIRMVPVALGRAQVPSIIVIGAAAHNAVRALTIILPFLYVGIAYKLLSSQV